MKRTTLLALLLLAVGLVACGGAEQATGEQTVTITARDIEFSTDRIEVAAGRTVVLTLANEGALEHDFSIVHIPLSGEAMSDETGMDDHSMTMDMEELDLHVSADAGHSSSVTFTPSEPGEYEFFCTVPGHREAGMAGTLVVTAP
jgi:uncharacterized cupredoxin-like copper-binding protein